VKLIALALLILGLNFMTGWPTESWQHQVGIVLTAVAVYRMVNEAARG